MTTPTNTTSPVNSAPAGAQPAAKPFPPPVAPETLEGWYALHQFFSVDHAKVRELSSRPGAREEAVRILDALAQPAAGGWSMVAPLIGSRADVCIMHFRPTMDDIGAAQLEVARIPLLECLRPVYSFLSVTEAGMYQATLKVAKESAERGGKLQDAAWKARMKELLDAELETPHVRSRLYPEIPEQLPYVCFYPMSKKREHGQNWYSLELADRARLMLEHGLTGRRYAGRVLQVVTGAMGLDAWEWGVTLFAKDPLEFKKIVAEMRFDEASAKYGEFGEFFVGKRASAAEWIGSL